MAEVSPLSGTIVVLDFGGQYAHLIASRIRRFGFRSDIRDPSISFAELQGVAGIILSGGPQSVYDAESPQAHRDILSLHVPILGICYGHHWLAHMLGGQVTSGHTKEYGRKKIEVLDPDSTLFQGLPSSQTVWMSHGDEVVALPHGFHCIAQSDTCRIAAMADESRRFYGVQFHLEVTHSEHGSAILRRFVDLCHPLSWNMQSYLHTVSSRIQEEAGTRHVFMLVSGGVDSTVAFTLLNTVLGPERVQGLLVDTGLMREGEVAYIRQALGALGIRNLHVEDASNLFFERLHGITDPEIKRNVIGDTFLDVQRRVASSLDFEGDHWLLGQGTIYPDTIETGGTAHADTIKTHHNRVEAIQAMIDAGRVIEPLKDLYKDEVRELGEEIGLPHDLVWRHPFPGPGLGVRILCTTPADIRRNAPTQSLRSSLDDVPESRVLPLQSVGVQGDGRTYRHAVVLFHASRIAQPHHFDLATAIPNANPAFNRVLFCTSHSEPVAMVATPLTLTKQRADLLRTVDALVDRHIRQAGLYDDIWQFPVVLLPVGATYGGQSIVLRPVHSMEAMTANVAHLPGDVVRSITDEIMAIEGIDMVCLDLTDKPPATIEWE